MTNMKKAIIRFILLLLLPQYLFAADVVPFSVKRIKPIGSGYVELMGPGEIQINNEILPYQGSKYIRAANIGTMTSIVGSTKGCILAYSSENYTESISVLNQSCDEMISILNY